MVWHNLPTALKQQHFERFCYPFLVLTLKGLVWRPQCPADILSLISSIPSLWDLLSEKVQYMCLTWFILLLASSFRFKKPHSLSLIYMYCKKCKTSVELNQPTNQPIKLNNPPPPKKKKEKNQSTNQKPLPHLSLWDFFLSSND